MRATNGILYVRNIEQQAAFSCELVGQLSDGAWENATPHDHWHSWCDCDVVVAEPGEPVGRDFWAQRDSYNFTRKDLLDVVGRRMLGHVRLARALGIKAARELRYDVSCEGALEYPTFEGRRSQYWNERRERITRIGRERIAAALADESYTMTDLRRDLRDLQKIIKMKRASRWAKEQVAVAKHELAEEQSEADVLRFAGPVR